MRSFAISTLVFAATTEAKPHSLKELFHQKQSKAVVPQKSMLLEAEHPKLMMSGSDFASIFEGVIVGFAAGNGFAPEISCFQDVDELVTELDNYLSQLNGGTSEAENALKYIGNIFHTAANEVLACGYGTSEYAIIKDLIDDLVKFADPGLSTFVNIAWNWYGIYSLVNGAVSAYDDGEMFDLGEDIGKLLAKAE